MASDSSVPAPHANIAKGRPPSFSREETEAFVSYARSRVGEAHGDRMLEWCSSPEYRSRNVSMKRTRTLSKRAVSEHIPEGVKSANFTETLDGSQRLIFYPRGPWSGHQIIPYPLSDVCKIKRAVAVMTAYTVRIH